MKKRKILRLSYFVGMCISFLIFFASIAIAIYFKDVAVLVDAIPFFIYGALFLDHWRKEKVLEMGIRINAALLLELTGKEVLLNRYEKLYGKLQEEQKEKSNEGNKEEE